MKNKLTKDNYFEDNYYMSTSKWKRFNECEEKGLAPYPPPSDDMLIGSYVDAWVEGTLDQFKQDHPEIISSRGKTKGQLKAGFKQADEIIEYMKSRDTIMQFLSDEKQRIMVGEIEGVPTKIMMDNYSKGIAINDLKIMRSITNRQGDYIDFVSMWGYDYQGAIYQEIVRQNTGETLPFFLIAITKEEPINSAIINIPQEILDTALETVKSSISRYYSIMKGELQAEGCGKCSVCIQKRKDVPIISFYDLIEG